MKGTTGDQLFCLNRTNCAREYTSNMVDFPASFLRISHPSEHPTQSNQKHAPENSHTWPRNFILPLKRNRLSFAVISPFFGNLAFANAFSHRIANMHLHVVDFSPWHRYSRQAKCKNRNTERTVGQCTDFAYRCFASYGKGNMIRRDGHSLHISNYSTYGSVPRLICTDPQNEEGWLCDCYDRFINNPIAIHLQTNSVLFLFMVHGGRVHLSPWRHKHESFCNINCRGRKKVSVYCDILAKGLTKGLSELRG